MSTHVPETAEDWDREYHQGHHKQGRDTTWPSPELAGIVSLLERREGAVAVDLGCGTGSDCCYLAALGYVAIGVDMSQEALDIAAERAQKSDVEVSWICSDVLETPLEAASVDLVVERGCLHHIAVEDRGRFIAELDRVLRPGAVAVLRDSCAHGHGVEPVPGSELRELTSGSGLTVRSVVPYAMVHGHGAANALLSVLTKEG